MRQKRCERRFFQRQIVFAAIICAVFFASRPAQGKYRPAKGPLMTQWAKDVSPENAHQEYPRPQMARKDWLNLNGLWEYAIRAKNESQPKEFDGQILVPFPVESALSGVKKSVGENNRLWYRRTFKVPRKWQGKRVLLHFGAVDWDATVWVNGSKLGSHRGGYDPFTFDITAALKDSPEQQIVLSVWDPSDAGPQPRGKQVRKPSGIWYTSTTGIWQTAWLEPVPQAHIKSMRIDPDLDNNCFRLTVDVAPDAQKYVVLGEVILPPDSRGHSDTPGCWAYPGRSFSISLPTNPKPRPWSPDSPYLYDLRVALHEKTDAGTPGEEKIDEVTGYCGLRKIALGRDESGILRLFLNNKPVFMYGPLDQGFWPDGLYTAPTDEALRYDIEVTKKLGCNMARKHVKVEPDRWYYWCDKLGLMVWQDMASGNNNSNEARSQFELELGRVVDAFRNHPSIVMWVPFNEGWGQHDTPRIVELIRQWDPTRLINQSSGWTDRGVGDVHDIHSYPGPASPPAEQKRAVVLGEFGGLGLPLNGHTWQDEKNWGYRSFATRGELTDAYVRLIENLRALISGGLSAAVYTQTTDVEIEINGLMTYDRALIKPDAEKVAAVNRKLYLPPPIIKMIVPTAERQGQRWRYTTTKPADGWEKPDFDDSSWRQGQGGFGVEGTPGAIVRTEWRSSDIWIRREFSLSSGPESPYLSIHHDEDAEVYINGRLVAGPKGYTTGYVHVSLDEQAKKTLKAGRNCIAVHCHQISGGQYIDAGLVEVTERTGY